MLEELFQIYSIKVESWNNDQLTQLVMFICYHFNLFFCLKYAVSGELLEDKQKIKFEVVMTVFHYMIFMSICDELDEISS